MFPLTFHCHISEGNRRVLGHSGYSRRLYAREGSSLSEGEVDFSSCYVRFLKYSRKLVAQSVKFERKPMFDKLVFYLVNYLL